ncbi:MAG: Isoprenylcysteine carboxyl methyltransferase (ICMT) family protein [Elusimicrobia bacterium ADurb.Bin231]|nr:MAG: Isoprenylcysteine carboxyl methyltransferase (ICMT) family protein [Elusimicrobia bacterium ADurb.Bin231]
MYNKLRKLVALLFVPVFLMISLYSEKLCFAGLFIVAAGEFIRVWSAGYIRKNKVLSVVGPYKYVRNPLYVGSLLIGLGFAVFIVNIYIFIIVLATFLYIYTLQIKSEEKALESIFGNEYERYKKNVHRWIPSFKKYRAANSADDTISFDIKLAIVKNKEYNAILGCISIVFAILLIRAMFRN